MNVVLVAYRIMQEELEALFSSLDKTLHGSETGQLTKDELRQSLESFFAVGQPGGKTLNRFDELMQVGTADLILARSFFIKNFFLVEQQQACVRVV